MQRRLNHFMLLFVILAVIVTSAVRTTAVYADDGVTDPPTGESTPPAEGGGTSSTDEAPPAEAATAASEESAATEVTEPTTTTPVAATEEAAPATADAAEEPASVPEVLEQLPENTELVVVNAEGEVEPLASAEAAEIIASGDPVWCPASLAAPTPGANGCTSSQTDFASLILILHNDATSGSPVYGGQNGTIWVAQDYNGADNSPITFTDTYLPTLNNHNLTIQGGWNGTSGDATIGTASLADVSMNFVNWTGDITINNFNIDVTNANTTGTGLYIDTVGNITLNDVSVVDNVTNTKGSGDGAFLRNTRNPSVVRNVTVNNSRFNGNSLTGLYIDSYGTATLTNVQANENGYGLDITADAGIDLTGVTATSNSYFGGILDTTYGAGAISVTNGNFGVDAATNNGWTGLHAVSGSTITLDNTSASYNGTNGAYLVAEGNITVNGTFNNNVQFCSSADPGLYAESNGGSITLNSVVANNNSCGAGAVLNTSGAGTIDVNGGQFSGNGTFGVQANTESGNITLNGVTASYNGIKGAYLHSSWLGNISINNSTFVENGTFGIFAATADGDVNANNVTVTGNNVTVYGANLATATGSVTVSNSTFTLNQDVGLDVVAGNQVTLTNVTADQNGGTDVEVFSITTGGPICNGETPVSIDVHVNGGTFTNSGGYGLMVKPGPEGTLTFDSPATFGNNGWGDYLLDLSQQYKNCTPEPKEPPVTKGPLIVDVPSTGGPTVEQDCDLYTSTILRLPDGTWVEIGCPFEGFSKLEQVPQENLPGPLGVDMNFLNAIAFALTDAQGNIILNEDGTVTINFVIPEGSRARGHSILFWDAQANNGAGGWVELPPYEVGTSFPLHPDDPNDPRTIISGVQKIGNTVTVTVDFSGVFVLVER
jgi:hypothetical protein